MRATKTKRFSGMRTISMRRGVSNSISKAALKTHRPSVLPATSHAISSLIPRFISATTISAASSVTLSSLTRFICGGTNPEKPPNLQRDFLKNSCRLRHTVRNSRAMKSSTKTRALVTSLVATAFLWMLALSSSPHLHARVHSDANQIEHTCAVTFVTSGKYSHSVSSPVISAPVPPSEFSEIRVLRSVWVQPLFLNAHIFAHAPPAHS